MLISNLNNTSSTVRTAAPTTSAAAPTASPENSDRGASDRVSLSREAGEGDGSSSVNSLLQGFAAWDSQPESPSTSGQQPASTPASASQDASVSDQVSLASPVLQAPEAVDELQATPTGSGPRVVSQGLGTAGRTAGMANALVQISQGEDVPQNAASLAAGTAETGEAVGNAMARSQARRRAENAFRQAAPGANRQVSRAASREAVRSAVQGAPTLTSQYNTTRAARSAARTAPGSLAQNMGTRNRRTGQRALETGSNRSSTVARESLENSRWLRAARLAGPFVPFLNGVSAGMDGVQAYRDSQGSNRCRTWSSGITAVGSFVSLIPHPVTRIGGLIGQGLGAGVGLFCSNVSDEEWERRQRMRYNRNRGSFVR